MYSKTKEQQWEHLQALLFILAASGFALNLNKCVFAVTELDILNHHITTSCVASLWYIVRVILDFPSLADCKALQRLLGMIDFFCHFLTGIAWTLRPLTSHR